MLVIQKTFRKKKLLMKIKIYDKFAYLKINKFKHIKRLLKKLNNNYYNTNYFNKK